MKWMDVALEWAQKGALCGEVPVGAVLVQEGDVLLAVAHNTVEAAGCPLNHAEILVLLEGHTKLGKFLSSCDLYVTLEPCPMCAYAIGASRVRRLYFGAYDPKGGGVEHGPQVRGCYEVYGGIQAASSTDLLQKFFRALR